MDVEFHYYMTYLIAVRAGFSPEDAYIIAHASENVDDNHVPVEVRGANDGIYKNTISQTMDITRPHLDGSIYPIFHFVPGDKTLLSAARKDGIQSDWVTTPNNQNAQSILDAAFQSQDLYRIGLASHTYVDTWAHQNFVGKYDVGNKVPLEEFALSDIETLAFDAAAPIGHGAALHYPDEPGRIWTDGRLIGDNIRNCDRFMEAAQHLFYKYAQYTKKLDSALWPSIADKLKNDLLEDIGLVNSDGGEDQASRIGRYKARALKPEYGGKEMPPYDERDWFNQALVVDSDETALFARLRAKLSASIDDYFDMVAKGSRIFCTWKDPANYKDSHWYKFQQAVTAQKDFGTDLLQDFISTPEVTITAA